ncbi:MAG: type I restriction enzyme HsdR N-terminal domain-containing protein [Anaerotignum sp.]|nr:type I restriction enzyme HsdR N-terminal domain-containing protein [Anaerotignum sp.]MBQ7084137.1 type I restriction enzyme HsdR N-terminal domain-containing protein [Anaerotignum sp.]
MATINAKVKTRLIEATKRFKPIVSKAKSKDVNESDTVAIITDILADVFGYDKYSDITSEYAIKKTYCDLAIKINGQLTILLEAKAAGLNLKESHIKQAVDYGANAGVDWVILTNSVQWMVYRIIFGKPVVAELVYDFDFTEINTKKESDLELLYYLTKESMTKAGKGSLDEFHSHKQMINKFVVAQTLLSDPVLDAVRKTLKKVSPDVKGTNEEIYRIINEEIIKRDVLDDEKTVAAKKMVSKALNAAKKASTQSND